jgi:glutamyl-tRNA synthetase
MKVRGRYAPSPTGALHLGNARTALLAWLDTRSRGGAFILRMEDLDPQRSLPDAARGILEDLRWMGLDWDEGPDVAGTAGPYEQSQRSEIYRDVVTELLHKGLAFECTCSRAEVARAAQAPHAGEDGPRYPGTCRAGPSHPDRLRSVRFRVPPGAVSFTDLVHGEQTFDVGAEVGDFVLRRADGVAAYQLAVAVDDARMGITHVIRGDDLLSSTPRQLLILGALDAPAPTYGHVPLLLGEDGHRLAKRGGALTLQALRARGVSPQAIIGFLAHTAGLGDGHAVSASELVPQFDLRRLATAPATVTERALGILAEATGPQ